MAINAVGLQALIVFVIVIIVSSISFISDFVLNRVWYARLYALSPKVIKFLGSERMLKLYSIKLIRAVVGKIISVVFIPTTQLRAFSSVLFILMGPLFCFYGVFLLLEKTGISTFMSKYVSSKSMVALVAALQATIVYHLMLSIPKSKNLSFFVTGSSSPVAWQSLCYLLLACSGIVAVYAVVLIDKHRNDRVLSESYSFALGTMVTSSMFVGISAGILFYSYFNIYTNI